MAPTLFGFDSAELVTGAHVLGIVHSPGYPLYLSILHVFQWLPVGDVAFRGNLFSSLCLALSTPFISAALHRITQSRMAAVSSVLVFTWSVHVWRTGLFAEVYAPQILTLALCGWALTKLPGNEGSPHLRWVWISGTLFSVAVAMHPTSILCLPGLVVVYRIHATSWKWITTVVGLCLLIPMVSLAYFPLRYAANPPLNLAGHYGPHGTFKPVDLNTVRGLVWMITGGQFSPLFFNSGPQTTFQQVWDTVNLFARNSLGFGLVLGVYGLWRLFSTSRQHLGAWLATFVPYVAFYTTYCVVDKETMFGPAFLLGTIPFAIGTEALAKDLPAKARPIALSILPLTMLLANYGQVDLSRETSIRYRAEAILEKAPQDTHIFAEWSTASAIQYLQHVEEQRPDVRIYNTFLFPSPNFQLYISELISEGETVWICDQISGGLPGYRYVPLNVPRSQYANSSYYQLER